MSRKSAERPHAQTAEDKKPEHYLADWWIYAVLALFIGGLVFLTYAVVLRSEVMTDFGKPGGKASPTQSTAPPPAEKK